MTQNVQTNDIISDILTRIRNAIHAKKEVVALINTKAVLEVLNVLSNYGFVGRYEIDEETGNISVHLKVDNQYKINELKRVSRPGLRKYIGAKDVKQIKGGRGIAVLSTSQGIISDEKARKDRAGGEYLFYVW